MTLFNPANPNVSFRYAALLCSQRWWLTVADAMQAQGKPPHADEGSRMVLGMREALCAAASHYPLDLAALYAMTDEQLTVELNQMMERITMPTGMFKEGWRPSWLKETDDVQ